MCLLRTAKPEDTCLIHVLVTSQPEPFLVDLYQVRNRKTGTILVRIIIIVFYVHLTLREYNVFLDTHLGHCKW